MEDNNSQSLCQPGNTINIRNFDIGMTIIFPKFLGGQLQCDENKNPLSDSDIWISKTEEPVDMAWQIHLIGAKAEYIFTHLDSPDDSMNTKDAYLMKNIDENGKKYGFFYNEDGDICIRPHFLSYKIYEEGYIVLWIKNDNEQCDEFTSEYILIIKPF